MTFSPLTDEIMRTDKRSSRGGAQIVRVNVHHWGGTRGGIERLVQSSDQASANYIIRDNGSLIGSVDEEYRAWTSGSHSADAPAITVEIQNATTGPEWRVSAAAIKTLVALLADIAKRYRWGEVTRSRVRGHREFAATACPGPYLYPRLGRIAKDAEKVRTGGGSPSKPKPSTGGGSSSKPAKSHEWPGAKLRIDGQFGRISKRAYQRLLEPAKVGNYRGRIDGVFGKLSVQAEQRWLRGLGYDAGPSDGDRGPRTIKALQAKLYDDGHYRNGKYSKSVMVDGSFGKRSVQGLQRYLNAQRKYYK